MYQSTISLTEPDHVLHLFGTRDQHLRSIRDAFDVAITHREGEIRISGTEESVGYATAVLEQLKMLVERQNTISPDEVAQAVAAITGDLSIPASDPIEVISMQKQIKPRTPGQARYVDAIRKHDLVFALGPAGTGKTYLAVALAVEALKQQVVRKIVLVRPAVEAGENLGFLPGDLHAKINPYLRPLLDALHEMVDYDQIKQLMDRDTIEVLPLAYMRGRTLNEAFIILDEAQNTTVSQMKMFLTRMGEGSRIVVSGDTTQSDLPPGAASGLIDAQRRLKGIRGVCEVTMSNADIVRHRLVADIVRAYESDASKNRKGRNMRGQK